MNGKRSNLWRGLTTCMASMLAVSITAGPLVDSYRTDIDKFLGTKSTRMVTEESGDENLYTYKSDYSNTTELLDAIEDLGERVSEEGSVLLKNENQALPLSEEETQKHHCLDFPGTIRFRAAIWEARLRQTEGWTHLPIRMRIRSILCRR